MSYNLTIDQGNSAAKLAVWDGENLVTHCLHDRLDPSRLLKLTSRYPLRGAIYCSVAASGATVINALRHAGMRVYELTHLTPLPIQLGYRTPKTLGHDRIAAAVGAWNRHRGEEVLVVDIGTAITYDLVTADGVYLGGNIAPGPRMRLEALNHYTARLPLVELDQPVELWGRDTCNALRSGAINGVVGEIEYYRSQLSPQAVTVITGGDSDLITPHLTFQADIEPQLVSEGLNCILRYNEIL
ncbi:MAG: type III pantothenate kinase [Bacteroidales bacterium]|nr:type III pantothenate kinase [Bacteroidales bacterium]